MYVYAVDGWYFSYVFQDDDRKEEGYEVDC